MAARKPVEAHIDAAKRRLSRLTQTAALDGHVGNADTLRRQWPTLTLSRQRAIVRALLAHVTIHPAVRGRNRFDPRRVEPLWRV